MPMLHEADTCMGGQPSAGVMEDLFHKGGNTLRITDSRSLTVIKHTNKHGTGEN